VKKFVRIQSLCALLVATTASVRDVPLPRSHAAPHLLKAPAGASLPEKTPSPEKTVAAAPEVLAAAARPHELPVTVDDLDRPRPGWRSVAVIEPTRPWVLPDKTWRAIAESRWNVDVSFEPGHEYIGVRVVLPFGS
jgi:hypothetical protein